MPEEPRHKRQTFARHDRLTCGRNGRARTTALPLLRRIAQAREVKNSSAREHQSFQTQLGWRGIRNSRSWLQLRGSTACDPSRHPRSGSSQSAPGSTRPPRPRSSRPHEHPARPAAGSAPGPASRRPCSATGPCGPAPPAAAETALADAFPVRLTHPPERYHILC